MSRITQVIDWHRTERQIGGHLEDKMFNLISISFVWQGITSIFQLFSFSIKFISDYLGQNLTSYNDYLIICDKNNKVCMEAKIRNRYNQVPHLTQIP